MLYVHTGNSAFLEKWKVLHVVISFSLSILFILFIRVENLCCFGYGFWCGSTFCLFAKKIKGKEKNVESLGKSGQQQCMCYVYVFGDGDGGIGLGMSFGSVGWI